MRIHTVFLFLSIVLTAPVSYPQGVEPLTAPESRQPSRFEFVGPWMPEVVGWSVEEGEGASIARLSEEDNSIVVDEGQGCMAFLRSGSVPILQKIDPVPGSHVLIQGLRWQGGTTVTGYLEDADKLPVTANVKIRYESSAGEFDDPVCRDALSALGVFDIRSSTEGHFEIPALPPGRILLTIEGDGYSLVHRRVTLTEDQPRKDLGVVKVPVQCVAEISVDPSNIDETPPFGLLVEIEEPNQVAQKDRWRRIEETELSPDAPVRVATKPGLHRLTLRKTGTDLAYSTLAETTSGIQELIIRPAPYFLEGYVKSGGDHIEDAEVMLLFQEVQVITRSDEGGFYQLRLWFPADFATIVTIPGGDAVMNHLDLRDAQLGETIGHDFEIPRKIISGVIVSSEDQMPIPDCQVTLIQKSTERGDSRSVSTSSDGRFEFGSVWDSDTCRIRAEKKGFLPTSREVFPSNTEDQDIWIELEPTDEIAGRVTGPAGEPIAGILVGCCAPSLSDPLAIRATTSIDGSFSIESNPGAVLFASAQGYALGWIAARDDQENHLMLDVLPQPTRLRILNSEDRPVEGAYLTFVSPDGVGIPFDLVVRHAVLNGLGRHTDSEGLIDIACVPYGSYQVFLKSATGPVPLGTVPFPASGEVTLHTPDR